MHVLKSPWIYKGSPLFVRKKPTNRIAWLRPCSCTNLLDQHLLRLHVHCRWISTNYQLNPCSLAHYFDHCMHVHVQRFDSLCSTLPTMVQAQIACIMSTAENTIKVMDVQQLCACEGANFTITVEPLIRTLWKRTNLIYSWWKQDKENRPTFWSIEKCGDAWSYATSAMSGFTCVVTKYQTMFWILQRPSVIVATAQSQTDIFYAELSACT